LALAADLAARGVAVHIVTRGYGGNLAGPVRVELAHHDAAAVGDEALLLAKRAPCWVARNRAAGIRAAVAVGAEAVVLDDAFQNPTIAKTLSLVVVDAAYGFGNGRIIPAGPLRENPGRGLARAGAVVLLGTEREAMDLKQVRMPPPPPVVLAELRPIAGERFAGSRLLAFAGIGRPQKFFATVRTLGAELAGMRAFPDHHPYRASDIEQLHCDAERAQARLVTTAKDIVRIPPASRDGIEVLEVEISWRDPAALDELIRPIVGPRRRR
jgi:tetraacyldisaccharide 4'-kinase